MSKKYYSQFEIAIEYEHDEVLKKHMDQHVNYELGKLYASEHKKLEKIEYRYSMKEGGFIDLPEKKNYPGLTLEGKIFTWTL